MQKLTVSIGDVFLFFCLSIFPSFFPFHLFLACDVLVCVCVFSSTSKADGQEDVNGGGRRWISSLQRVFLCVCQHLCVCVCKMCHGKGEREVWNWAEIVSESLCGVCVCVCVWNYAEVK